ncbi:inositol monophosphatase family protein [Paenibacillus radicis (ex Xue et al. 2023)]|uniref:Inositol-1-monophosphatase n=1 Tax=Paenibacillus radicis (ex Xue et al. 2023) TaxID=2972489 RepID=A0ABT1YK82_9BACL|nr:inositol monophosphatase family protein [Paenibacillus radicis (ex Xue et al. 2023)]MCR8632668.1 inositol monophosphatase [Paenibacillus radicis (ex Xue et al. 2023)]
MTNHDYIEVAQRIARATGLMIKERIGTSIVVQEKASRYDLVTEVDQAAERMIRELLSEIFPKHRILGEEEAFHDGVLVSDMAERIKSEEYLWIVDPIDGTNNFIHGLPGYTVSIALAHWGELIAGVVYDPTIDEMYWAEKGGGAYLNGKRIQVSTAIQLEKSIIGTGFPSNIARDRHAVIDHIGSVGPICLNIRVYGSAALQLAYVAAGKLDASWDLGLKVWDIAAGAVLISEAGGKLTDVDGSPYALSTENMLASNIGVHHDLVNHLNPKKVSSA